LPFLFAITLFVSATLLFLVQPMIAKMILPLLGGTPAVWNTCMVFFQAALLAGYAYAHATTTWLGLRRQVLLHTVLLFLPLLVLPITVAGWTPRSDVNPIPWLLTLLAVSVGLPFFVLSASAPLLQRWFAHTGHASAKDPYFLYAASNLGSMLALLSYPTLVEPHLPLNPQHWFSQSKLWAGGYGFMVLLVAACAWIIWRLPQAADTHRSDFLSEDSADSAELTAPTGIDALTRLRWVALAFVPSSLMLGTTTYITMDIASIPLLWVIPLALYLLSFILVFARWGPTLLHKGMVMATPLTILVVLLVSYRTGDIPSIPLPWAIPAALCLFSVFFVFARWSALLHKTMVVAMPVAILLLLFMRESGAKMRIETTILMHLLTLLIVALVCHGELARTRPAPRHLTEFYFLMSLGGVLGGLFNALVAPLVFRSVLEYEVALVCACLLLPRLFSGGQVWLSRLFPERLAGLVGILVDVALAAILGLVTFWLIRFFRIPATPDTWLARLQELRDAGITWCADKMHHSVGHTREVLAIPILGYGLPILLCYAYVIRPVRFGLAVSAFLLVCLYWTGKLDYKVLHQERSFFGVLKVQYEDDDNTNKLIHGTTLHGKQSLAEGEELEPMTYYDWSGPIGQTFRALRGGRRNIAVLGLGCGTLACYGRVGDDITFYDIDPAVVRISRDEGYFTFLQHCRAKVHVVLGDARLRMAEAEDGTYNVIVADAFSSDSIPIHLITFEAIELYFRKLAPGGLLVVHISNRYLDLRPVLANAADRLGLACIRQYYGETDNKPGTTASDWVLLARREEDFRGIVKDISQYPDSEYDAPAKDNKPWRRLEPNPKVGVWTDDFSNILGVFIW
jgi:hypothetical protein